MANWNNSEEFFNLQFGGKTKLEMLEQAKQEFQNLGMVNYATIDFICKTRLGMPAIPVDILDALEKLSNVLNAEVNELV